jgi:hypothetical protein
LNTLKKKIDLLGIIVLLIVVMASLAACASAAEITLQPAGFSPQSQALLTPAASQLNSSQVTSTSISSSLVVGGTPEEILSLASGIASAKYEMVTTIPNFLSTTANIWVKNTRMRMETAQLGQTEVILINDDNRTIYMFQPSQNIAFKMDFSQAPESAADSSNAILQYAPTIVGTETLDGKVCQVMQYTADGIVTKIWVWVENGLPVRILAATPLGTTTTDFKNYDFNEIQDSVFELPAGMQITSLSLPSDLLSNLLSGLPPGLLSAFPTDLTSTFPISLPPGLLTGLPTVVPSK